MMMHGDDGDDDDDDGDDSYDGNIAMSMNMEIVK